LIPFDPFFVGIFEIQEFNIHLDMMARDLFFVAPGMYGALFRVARKSVEAVAFEHAVDTSTRNLDTMVPL
jgi:hypothetical protein